MFYWIFIQSQVKLLQKYHYRAGAFNGVRSFSGVATGGSRNCGIFACTGDTKDTCGKRFETYEADTTVIFEELKVIGTVPTAYPVAEIEADDSAIFPLSMTVSIMPLEVRDYSYYKEINGSTTTHTLNLENVSAELYNFALWGRVFATDGQDADPPVEDSATIQVLSRGMIISVIGLLLYNQFWN